MPLLSKIVIIYFLDFGNWTLAMGLEIRRFLEELGEFLAIVRFLDFPISTVVIYKVKEWQLNKFWAIGRDFW